MSRRKKRTHGEYLDETTGEISIVETTKSAKRAYQKSGKWYKEPTEADLRIWEREDAKRKEVEKARTREENSRRNREKKERDQQREQDLKKALFEAGRLTFTQTLARKDEDQLNLHAWFGGRPKQPKPEKGKRASASNEHNGAGEEELRHDKAVCGRSPMELVRSLSQESSEDDDDKAMMALLDQEQDISITRPAQAKMDQPQQEGAMDQLEDLDLDGFSQDFDIAEDGDVDSQVLKKIVGQDNIDKADEPEMTFKLPALPPKRPPLSPMSNSELNVRNGETLQISSFKDRLQKADVSMPPSTQLIGFSLAALSTQDLADDFDEDLLSTEDKENGEPSADTSPSKLGSPLKKSSPLKQVESAEAQKQSFTSAADSCDYNDIFAKLVTTTENNNWYDGQDDTDHEFDGGLDDDDLLSLGPATQLVSSAKTPHLVTTKAGQPTLPPPSPIFFSPNAFKIRKPAKAPPTTARVAPPQTTNRSRHPHSKERFSKSNSFALDADGFSEDDLVEALNAHERSQPPKTRRTMPWHKPDWHAATTAPAATQYVDDDEEDASMQLTLELLSSCA